MHLLTLLDPNTRRRLARFGKIKRAKWSLWLLLGIFAISLCANFIANDKPLLVWADGKLYAPVLKFYPEDAFTGSGIQTRPRYKQLAKLPLFTENPKNGMLWPLIPYGPEESLEAGEIAIDTTLSLVFAQVAQVATVDLDSNLVIQRSRGAAALFQVSSENDLRRQALAGGALAIPETVSAALAQRFRNEAAPALRETDGQGITFTLDGSAAGASAPKLVRLSLAQGAGGGQNSTAVLDADLAFLDDPPSIWEAITEADQARILARAEAARIVPQEPLSLSTAQGRHTVQFIRETIEFPFRPIRSHLMGLDNSGRDVGVRIFYATRTALAFGFLLVIFTFAIGIVLGAIQGFFGGRIDMVGQRLSEIWESMPFLLIMIFLSSVYGRSFLLLGFLYGIFNWLGISYYMRAEFLKLRKLPFVEAAKVMGIGRWKIMFRHILPNALVPVITFFPFALVGAIFVLTSLDFLGFGLPPGTPSWGNLLDQGQSQIYAWWLTLYPSLALFLVSLLGIFVGEGIRAAFDPRTEWKLS